MNRDRLFMAAVGCLPRSRLSRAARAAADLHSRMAVRRFAALYEIDVSDAEKPLDAYRSVHELFTRRLRSGARPVDQEPNVLVSPVDGRISAAGRIGEGQLFQAKGRTYRLEALLADGDALKRFAQGSYVTIYLAPPDYHRIHAPAEGSVRGWVHVPGDLYPVNRASVNQVDALFARNERLITYLATETWGDIAVVQVGATVVGRVRASYAPEPTTHVPSVREPRFGDLRPPVDVTRGEEIGVFEMGSTVILVTEKPFELESPIGALVRYGVRLAQLRPGPQGLASVT